ncbi:TPA: host specificity factor TipJ family phage tail protein [Klebsiella pneumoniae]|uniref:host specificity factor TipJ family phage tail protein n=1 Tax=Klebsiella pneumoniae complex TaxID=3390273 RepID=UPI00210941E6|nr:host specificity factor TipJ family phage tail protein [Klebsiella pneumoniae]HBQ5787767.1 kinase [Klebsiella pneumoniae subsp. pneumoniae]EIX9149814.1 kinase [Klebsiella pneumoniae]MCR4504506.1 host specificity factor TipJ family phage tail protein [Klebsiella pneumoniae]MDR4745591.1 host specificity factor TipJ family phage tail protein [Klebsiella pneumoniae]HBQ5840619.1 kinase [Klebsiella pneumoniae subsp. pneumoniae]
MTIKFYPSRLPGEPLETHEHGVLTLHEWMSRNVPSYSQDKTHPVVIELNGQAVPPAEWPLCLLRPDSDVRIYPIPYGTGLEIAAWVSVAVSIASTAYALFFAPKPELGGFSSSNASSLDLNPAKANTAKLGDPVREAFGRNRIYPDYLVQPVTRFDPADPTRMTVEMFVCLGYGRFSYTGGDFRVGETPALTLGEGFSYTSYGPGDNLAGDRRSEIWFNSTEVGGTSSGSGLDMAQTAPEASDIVADAMTVSGASVSFSGLDVDDDNDEDEDEDENKLPPGWIAGAIVTLKAPVNYQVSIEGGFNVLTGDVVSEIAPFSGMPVTLTFNGTDYDLQIATYTPHQDAVPGTGGATAVLRASASPSTYDFTITSQTFALTWQGITYTISLVSNYGTMSGLLAAINGGLNGSGLIAQDDGGVIRIVEISSPWRGGSITSSFLPASVFGDSPVFTAGTASSGGSPAVTASVTLAYDSGTAFSGLPEGSQRISLAHRGNEYQIASTDGPSATVQRVVNGVVDSTWSGFMTRTVVDFAASGINDNETWLGPFLACPQNEVVDAFEVNFAFPNGICGFQNNGNKRVRHVEYEIQYRVYGSGSGWTSKPGVYALKNINGLGFTERFDLSSPGLVEVRCRRRNEQGSNNARDSMFWQALRGRLLSRPTSYAGISTIGITVETGGQLAAQSDKRVSVVATRNYDGGGDRTISGAFLHLARSLGYRDDQIDIAALSTLEDTYWTPRGEYFDHQASSDSTSAKDIFDKIAEAGMGYFLLSDGLLSVGREGVKSWTGIITPQDTVEEMQTSFRVPSEDDFDGVDVKYINPVTWAEETVQCRTPENPFPRKTEAYTIDVAMTADRAWRIGMRRLMKYLHQRRTYTATTSMLGWCHDFGDHIILSDDIRTGKTQSCLIDAMIYDFQEITLHVTEPLDWSYANPRCWIQFQDGRPSSRMLTPQRVDDFTLTVPYNDDLYPGDWIMDDPEIDLPKLLFCDSEKGARHGIVQEVAPSGDSNCQITAPEYKEIYYLYDDATYPGDAA